MDASLDAYNESAEEYAKSRIGKEDTIELAQLDSYLSPGARVLDVGCAAGRDTRILKDKGYDAVGSDLAERLLDIARQQNPDIEFALADMRKLPFADNSFDAVWASAVLHHLTQTEMPDALREFHRVLAPGGIVYIHTKAGEGRLETSESSVQDETREFELITPDELGAMLSDCGFNKLSLVLKASNSRKGLFWATAFYKKSV